jgi:hypothetical protein
MMFALGLASVTFFAEFNKQEDEISVNLPQVFSNSPIYVYPKKLKTTTRIHCIGHSCAIEEIIEFEEENK